MRCPIDGRDLIVVERHGVDVRLCPVCQGVWLADGDLDIIVGRAIAAEDGDDLDLDLDDHRDAGRKSRRRDKYSDELDVVDRPRRSRHRRGARDLVEDYADF